MKKPFQLHERDFENLRDEYAGFCLHCMGVTRDSGVEPDAKGYECDVCNKKTIFGMEEALMSGRIQIIEDPKGSE